MCQIAAVGAISDALSLFQLPRALAPTLATHSYRHASGKWSEVAWGDICMGNSQTELFSQPANMCCPCVFSDVLASVSSLIQRAVEVSAHPLLSSLHTHTHTQEAHLRLRCPPFWSSVSWGSQRRLSWRRLAGCSALEMVLLVSTA